MTMTPTPNVIDRVAELEKEVKHLTRLVREMAAREKVLTSRLQMVARDHVQTVKSVKAHDVAFKKTDGKINQVHAQVQRAR